MSSMDGDGDLGDEVPLDDVAEGLVLADAVEVDREASGRADERRGGIAAIVDVGLEGVVLVLVDVDAVEAALHGVGEIDGVGVFDGLRGERLDRDGDVGQRHIQRADWRRCDYIDCRRDAAHKQDDVASDGS